MVSHDHGYTSRFMCIGVSKQHQIIIRNYPELEDIIRAIKPAGDSRITVGKSSNPAKYSIEPDEQWQWDGQEIVGPVFEVAASQDYRQFLEKLQRYRRFPVGYVVCIDMPYQKPDDNNSDYDRAAHVSVWKMGNCPGDGTEGPEPRCLMDRVPFRDAAGEALSGELILPLGYFVPRRVLAPIAPAFLKNARVVFTFASLCDMLRDAGAPQCRDALDTPDTGQASTNADDFGDDDDDVFVDVEGCASSPPREPPRRSLRLAEKHTPSRTI